MKVLVIEDDPSLREIICRSLEKERYVTEEAPDFQTALEKTADYTYDCILLDIMLPDGNGLDLLEELKKENKKRKYHHHFGQRFTGGQGHRPGSGCRRLFTQTFPSGRTHCPGQKCYP